jgi:hypothetical protein
VIDQPHSASQGFFDRTSRGERLDFLSDAWMDAVFEASTFLEKQSS